MFKLNPGLLALISILTVTGCRGDDAGGSETESGSSTTGASGTATDAPTTTTDTSATTTGVDPTNSGTASPPTTSGEPDTSADESGNFLTTNTDTGANVPGPNGATCSSDADCESMNCVSLLSDMVQFCGDCNEDKDCVSAGTGTACTISIATQSATCTNGASGSTCMSDEACMGEQFCENVFDVPVLPNTCSDCSGSADCDMGTLCTPQLNLMTLTGKKACVEPGSVMNNQLCPNGPEGDMVCTSGHCTEASLMGAFKLRICGECAQDSDCPMPGQTCTPAEVTMSGLSGSVCT